MVLLLAGGYLGVGAVFALLFVWRGVHRIDPVAEHASFGFRLMILPGAAALWPLLLRRWAAGGGAPPMERNAHRDATRQEGTS
ncbi:MAG: hypothetical protein ACREMO_04815 [Gemmatimonadales bacterium]